MNTPEFSTQPGLSIEDGFIVVRVPVPAERLLLEMSYNARVNQMPLAIMLEIAFDADFVDVMLQSATAERAQAVSTTEGSANP